MYERRENTATFVTMTTGDAPALTATTTISSTRSVTLIAILLDGTSSSST